MTIVEYFDYNCGFCRRLVPALHELLAQDQHVAIVYKEWPILGPVSVYAARCALAAQWQGKYLAAHDALLSGPHLAVNLQVEGILEKAGVNLVVLKRDLSRHAAQIDAVLARSEEEARALTLDGTPGLVVGRQLVPGIVDLGQLLRLVANSRQAR